MSGKRTFVRDGKAIDVSVVWAGSRVRAQVGDTMHEFDVRALPGGGVRLLGAGGAHTAFVAARGRDVQVRVDGRTYRLELARGRGAVVAGVSGLVEAPMTGTVLDVPVRVGEVVAADQPVVVLIAMKMEHRLAAGIAGKVVEVACAPGDTVDQGRVLVRVEASA